MSGGSSVREPDANRPGSVLRAEREALGVSVREVAETLNLSMTVIEAIESDDLDRLPGAVFARGYVRAYARLLELEPGPLMDQYPHTAGPMPETPAVTEPPIWEWIRRRPVLVLGVAGGLLVLLLVTLISLLLANGDGTPATGQDTDFNEAFDPSAAEVDSPTDWIESSQASDATREVAPGGSAAVSAVPGADPYPAEGAVRRITAGGDDQLSFGFSDDCWVEIKSGTGASLYSDLNRAGAVLELVGQGPFRILLGYAPGVRLTFNGEPVPLAPHTRNNVATLVLGQ
jgi:cytoskeleton protein RodZ